jgi:hypothetical protein
MILDIVKCECECVNEQMKIKKQKGLPCNSFMEVHDSRWTYVSTQVEH